MPIVFTQNVNAGLGIANGTFGHLYDIQFPEDARFRLVEDAGTGLQVLTANRHPSVVLVTVDRGEHAEPMPKPAVQRCQLMSSRFLWNGLTGQSMSS